MSQIEKTKQLQELLARMPAVVRKEELNETFPERKDEVLTEQDIKTFVQCALQLMSLKEKGIEDEDEVLWHLALGEDESQTAPEYPLVRTLPQTRQPYFLLVIRPLTTRRVGNWFYYRYRHIPLIDFQSYQPKKAIRSFEEFILMRDKAIDAMLLDVEAYLQKGSSVIAEGPFFSEHSRRRFLELARNYPVRTYAVWLHSPECTGKKLEAKESASFSLDVLENLRQEVKKFESRDVETTFHSEAWDRVQVIYL